MGNEKPGKPISPTMLARKMAFGILDISDAIKYITEDFPVRRTDELLMREIEKKARQRKISQDAVIRGLENVVGRENLRNWLSRESCRIGRDSAIKIAFGLKMTYEEADEFQKRCWHDGFYLRDYKDVIYRYCLENKNVSYDGATCIIKENSYLDNLQNADVDKKLTRERDATKYLDLGSKSIASGDELSRFIKENEAYFGSFHRRAYLKFSHIYKQLKDSYVESAHHYNDIFGILQEYADLNTSPDFQYDEASVYQCYAVSTEALCRHITMGIADFRATLKEKGAYNVFYRLVAENIPIHDIMLAIYKKRKSKDNGRIAEVDRKLLILAWLACEDGCTSRFKKDAPEIDMIEHIQVLNLDLLQSCGMSALDPRHPFDWIVMNSIYSSYITGNGRELDDVVDRMETLIDKMRSLYAKK